MQIQLPTALTDRAELVGAKETPAGIDVDVRLHIPVPAEHRGPAASALDALAKADDDGVITAGEIGTIVQAGLAAFLLRGK